MMRAWAPVSQWYETKKELLLKIKLSLEKEGIKIPYPHRVVWLSKEEADKNTLN